MRLRDLVSLVFVVGVGASAGDAFAYPFTPWGLQVKPGSAAFSQYVFASAAGGVASTYIQPGLGKRVDMLAGATFSLGDAFAAGPVEVLPRVFVTESVGLVGRAASTATPGVVELGPEVHAAWSSDRFAFTTNFGWRPLIGVDSSTGTTFAVLAPELRFSEHVSTFLEVNGTYDLAGSAGALSLLPGVGLAYGAHALSVGVTIPIADPTAVVAGVLYGVAWGA